jgi:hypothetical protein
MMTIKLSVRLSACPLIVCSFVITSPFFRYSLRLAGSEAHSLLYDGGVREMAVAEQGYKMIHNLQNFLLYETV